MSMSEETFKKEELFPELFCEMCLKDSEIKCKRDKKILEVIENGCKTV